MVYFKINERLQIGIESGYIEHGAACMPGWDLLSPKPIFRCDLELFVKYAELPATVQANLPVFKGKFEVFGKAGYGLVYRIF